RLGSGRETELAEGLDHFHGLKLSGPGGGEVAGLERADQSLEMRAGEVVGAADRAADAQAESGQEHFVAAEQDVEGPIVDVDASSRRRPPTSGRRAPSARQA